MLKRIYTKFISLNPFLKVVATLLTIFGVVGSGYVIKEISFFQTVINYNYSEKEKETKKEDVQKERFSSETTAKIKKDYLVKTQSHTKKTYDNTTNETKVSGVFSQYPKKNGSKKTVSFLITKNGGIDSKTSRFISNSVKKLNLNSPLLFDEKSLIYFNDFMSPTQAFLNHHEINKYLDYYFICDITPLETEKISGMDTFTSSLDIEGYLVNTKNNNSISFPYRNIKGAGFSSNDADLNVTQDLEKKLLSFIKVNI